MQYYFCISFSEKTRKCFNLSLVPVQSMFSKELFPPCRRNNSTYKQSYNIYILDTHICGSLWVRLSSGVAIHAEVRGLGVNVTNDTFGWRWGFGIRENDLGNCILLLWTLDSFNTSSPSPISFFKLLLKLPSPPVSTPLCY